ncbi:MAG: response regulator transcription factor [Acidobacteriota bacterium]
MSIRILLVDDHEVFLDGLRALLDRQPDMEVVGDAKGGRRAVRLARQTLPQVVVMDASMPGLNGFEATRQIVAEVPEVKVLCLSMHSEERFVLAMLDAGASGYLLKECALEELVRAVRSVAANQVYLSPGIAGIVVEACRAGQHQDRASAFSLLTAREREVLQLIAEGHATKEIAAQLYLSVKTIGTHREHLMDKLKIHSVAGLTKYAIRQELTSSRG